MLYYLCKDANMTQLYTNSLNDMYCECDKLPGR